MKLVTFENESEWLKWRLTGLGGSDAPIVMRLSPYRNPFELWLEKTGKKRGQKQNEAMRHGLDNEAKARDGYTSSTGSFMPPANVESDAHNWLHASLDGFDHDAGCILEIKAPFDIHDHLTAREGLVPDHYYPQVQHCMAVAGVSKAHYWSWWEDNGVLLEVPFDEKYWQEELLPAEQEFWSWVQKDEYPVPKGKEIRADSAYLRLEEEVYVAMEMRSVADERLRVARAKIEKLLSAKTTKGERLEATWTYKKGSFVPGFQRSDSLTLSFRRVK